MNADERYVRDRWEDVRIDGDMSPKCGVSVFVNNSRASGSLKFGKREAWSAAAAFTLDREEQIRQLRQDIAGVEGTLKRIGMRIIETGENCIPPVRAWCSASRILARLEAALAELTKGMIRQEAERKGEE